MATQSLQDPRPVVLLTRPAAQSARFAEALRARFGPDLAILISPLMETEALAPTLPPGPFAALILTSETGAAAACRLRAEGAELPGPAFCVGTRTAHAARGFQAVAAAGDATDLARLILSRPDPGPLLHLHGIDRAADMARLLPGRKVRSCAVYAQRARGFDAPVLDLLARPGPVLVPLFSPRSARLFAAALPPGPGADLRPVAISANARDALPAPMALRTRIAARPDAEAMVEALAEALADR
ncbi:uroporphyrinogen-III synthase [Pseudogemmobacter sonorensis]|uniref:uroporphyrinogen-III synthase n=1 Tax=Pseudogemmobacter sonorensis TaxID=2989681 RepID=UPI00369D7E30